MKKDVFVKDFRVVVDTLNPFENVENGHKIKEDPSRPKRNTKKHGRITEARLDKIILSQKS